MARDCSQCQKLRQAMERAYRELMNAQPHLAEWTKRSIYEGTEAKCVDSHVDVAMHYIKDALTWEEPPLPPTEEGRMTSDRLQFMAELLSQMAERMEGDAEHAYRLAEMARKMTAEILEAARVAPDGGDDE